MMVVRELEPLPKESGTTAMTALHSQHPPHPGHPCHLTSVQPSQWLSLLLWHEYTGTQHRCPSKRITQCLGHRNELLCWGDGESGAGSGGVGFKVVYNRMWWLRFYLESVISISGNSEIQKKSFASTLYIFGHTDTLFSLCFIKIQMRCCYFLSTTGILTKELLEITIFILTANFLGVTGWTWVTSCWIHRIHRMILQQTVILRMWDHVKDRILCYRVSF